MAFHEQKCDLKNVMNFCKLATAATPLGNGSPQRPKVRSSSPQSTAVAVPNRPNGYSQCASAQDYGEVFVYCPVIASGEQPVDVPEPLQQSVVQQAGLDAERHAAAS